MHVHHTGVLTAHGSHRHHDDPQHIGHIFARAVKEAKEAGYEIVHAGLTTDGVHHVHGHPPGESGEEVRG